MAAAMPRSHGLIAPRALPHRREVLERALGAGHASGRQLGRARLEAERVLELEHADHERDAGGEAGGDRVRDELHQPPEPREAHGDEDEAGHHAGDEQPGEPVPVDDRQEDHDERGGGAGDLEPRAAEQRADHAGDDRGVEPVLRRHVARDRERHRERQRDHADHQRREQIGAEVPARVALAQALAEAIAEQILGGVRERELAPELLRKLVDVT